MRVEHTSYRLADRVIASALPLPELTVVPLVPDWRVDLQPTTAAPRRGRPYHHWNAAHGYRWASFSRDGERLLLHFARTALCLVDAKTRTLVCHPIGQTGPDALRPALLNQALPLVLGEERLVLHASAVATPSGALVFAGAPGVGKSTLAAALALRGFPLISDDFLVVDQGGGAARAVPSGIEPRLWPDSLDALLPGRRRVFPVVGQRTTKRRLSPASRAGVTLAAHPLPIARVFLLSGELPAGHVSRASSGAAVAALTASTFMARVDDLTAVRQTFARVTSLLAAAPFARLGAMRDFQQLSDWCDVVQGRPVALAG